MGTPVRAARGAAQPVRRRVGSARFVDELGRHDEVGHPPYVAPFYRGVDAPALAVLRDPGPKADAAKGSCLLCVENDDVTSVRQLMFLAEAGIDPRDVMPWNAYPWYINAKPDRAQLKAGTEPLRRVIEVMRELRVVLLLGTDAQAAWRLMERQHGELIAGRRIMAYGTYHPSRGALRSNLPTAEERADEAQRREGHIREAIGAAARLIHDGGDRSP